MTIKFIIVLFSITVFSGLLFHRSYNRLMNGKIKYTSLKYRICGYAALNIFVIGLISSIGSLLTYIIELLFKI